MSLRTLTENALNEIEREKDYTPEETLVFLREREHFLTVSEGIRRELRRLGYNSNDEQQLLSDFKAVLKKAGFTTDQRKNAETWLIGNKLPSPRKNYPMRLCFAFGLKRQDALDFLWKVCHVNGFNFRRAEDVVFCYCLENDKNYDEAVALIKRYKEHAAEKQFSESDATKRTHTLHATFDKLEGMGESTFFEKLCANKKNFIGYSETAHQEFVRICNSLKHTLKADIAEYNRYKGYAAMKGYDHDISIYSEIIYAFEKISKAAISVKSPFGDIMDNFPQSRYLTDMFNTASAATDKEHDKARKIFALLYFADYALDPPPDGFYSDFVYALNDMFDKCGYAKLYPANTFDWLILNCVKSIDVIDPTEGLNPVELFNEVLELLAEEADS